VSQERCAGLAISVKGETKKSRGKGPSGKGKAQLNRTSSEKIQFLNGLTLLKGLKKSETLTRWKKTMGRRDIEGQGGKG